MLRGAKVAFPGSQYLIAGEASEMSLFPLCPWLTMAALGARAAGSPAMANGGAAILFAVAAAVAWLADPGPDRFVKFPMNLAYALLSAAAGAVLALPALRVKGPYLAMVTIAFSFIVQHVIVEMPALTGGQNGLMGLVPPEFFGRAFAEREMALLAVLLAGFSLYMFHRMGFDTGVDLDVAIETVQFIGGVLGRKTPGMVSRAPKWPS